MTTRNEKLEKTIERLEERFFETQKNSEPLHEQLKAAAQMEWASHTLTNMSMQDEPAYSFEKAIQYEATLQLRAILANLEIQNDFWREFRKDAIRMLRLIGVLLAALVGIIFNYTFF